jgi:hypothetical protein
VGCWIAYWDIKILDIRILRYLWKVGCESTIPIS